ncbi:MAG: Adenine DNA glycosylase, partial [Alphaproteobacteria bacterium MarineAlpha2_Bin1]
MANVIAKFFGRFLVLNYKCDLDIEAISQILLKWYDFNARRLPWRKKSKNSPYHIWISEIMLQQTTVKAVIPRYKSFIRRWPNIKKLSLASIDEILHEWQGLGYYSRAHNIYKTAIIINSNYKGRFPKNTDSLKNLPGIGDYTAGAVASIAFSKPILPVDVNIERVLARINGVFKNEKNFKSKINNIAKLFYEPKRPGDLTQAFMDFGSIICKSNNPVCEICPLSKFCYSFKKKVVHLIPGQKNLLKKEKKYCVIFFIMNSKNEILFRKRKNAQILKG